jgi:hypothetical protein
MCANIECQRKMNESFELGNLVECKNAKCQFTIRRKKFECELPKNTKIKNFREKQTRDSSMKTW